MKSVSLTGLENVSPEMASQLEGLGVSNLADLESMSESARNEVEAKMSATGQSWDWKWVEGWKSQAGIGLAGVSAAGIGAVVSAGGSMADVAGRAKGIAGAEVDAMKSVSLSGLENISPEMASQLEGLGVSNLADLESMSESARNEVEAKMSATGQSWDWKWVEGWKSQAGIGLAGVSAAGIGAVVTDTAVNAGGSMADVAGRVKGIAGAKLDAMKSVSLSGLENVSPEMASQLEGLGVSNLADLESMPESARNEVEATMSASGQSWDWKWVEGWKSKAGLGLAGASAAGIGAAVTDAAVSAGGSMADVAGRAKGIAGAKLDAMKSVSLSGLENVSPEMASQLEGLGVRNLADLESMPESARNEVEATMSASGQPWDWKWVDDWKSKAGIGLAGANAAGIKLPEVDGPTVDWNKIDGIDPRVATRLGQLGIRNIEQLENLSGEDREVIEAKLSLEGTQWDWNWIHQWKEQVVSNPSIVECDSPTEVSSSTTLSAADHASKIDRKASRSRWGFGASLFGRLSGEKSGESSSSDQSSTTKGASRDVDDSTETRVLGFSSGSDSQPVSDPVSMDPSVLPKFDLGIPRVKDDLTLLDGIGSEQTEALHQMGIHDFDHLHDLSSVNRKRLQAYFQYRGWHLDMDQWRIASEGNTKDPTMEEIQQKAYEVYLYRDQHGLHGWEKSDWDQAEWQLRGNPSFAIGIPHHVDDFVETAKITPEAREELYRMGLYHHGQIDALDTKERRMLARWFAGPRFGIDITSAFNWLSSLKSVPPRNYGETHLNRPDSVDDLTDINGIGPATERELNRIGVFQLLQIAQWDEENVRSVSETLHFEDRIQTDMWVVQAQRLAGTS